LSTQKRQVKGSSPALEAAAKKYKRALQEIEQLSKAACNASTPLQRSNDTALLLEVVMGVNNDQRQPVPERVDVWQLPGLLLEALHHPVGRGNSPATDLAPGPSVPLDCRDPLPSTFWKRPDDISAEDLYHGFGRTNLSGIEERICSYYGPKDSYGTNPGFEVECEGERVKLKFAELSSEPFTTRIYDALGFHADVTDFAPSVRVHYDRRILSEFNSRRELTTRFTLFGITYYTLHLQKRYDPFRYVTAAILRDGRHWSGAELKRELFRDPARNHPEEDAANFRPEVESNLDFLVTVAANVQPKNPDIKTIGSWDTGQLDHAGRRELRGVGLLAAWLGFFDTRYDNMRVRLVKSPDGDSVVHYFADLGGGMGRTSGFLFMHGERPNDFPWSFTKPPLRQGPGRMARPLRIHGYKPLAPTEAFADMTIDDARWMARLIGQLSENQILEALAASGYDSAETRLYAEKLIARRDCMIADLSLVNEIPLLRPGGVNRYFSYDPAVDCLVSFRLFDGHEAKARAGDSKVVRGRLMAATPPASNLK